MFRFVPVAGWIRYNLLNCYGDFSRHFFHYYEALLLGDLFVDFNWYLHVHLNKLGNRDLYLLVKLDLSRLVLRHWVGFLSRDFNFHVNLFHHLHRHFLVD